MDYIIRKATIDDAYALAKILSESWASAYKHIIPPAELARQCDPDNNFNRFRTMLQAPRGEFYIALDGILHAASLCFANQGMKICPALPKSYQYIPLNNTGAAAGMRHDENGLK